MTPFDPSAFLADPELIQTLGQFSVPIVCSEERILFRQGESPAGVYILFKGKASLWRIPVEDGELLPLQVDEGSLVGLPALVGNVPYKETAIASRGAEVGFVSRKDFASLMRTDPLFSLLHLLTEAALALQKMIEDDAVNAAQKAQMPEFLFAEGAFSNSLGPHTDRAGSLLHWPQNPH